MHKHTEVGRNAIRTTWTDNRMLQHAPVLNIVPKESKPAEKAAGMMQAELVCYSPCIAQMPVMDWFVIVFSGSQCHILYSLYVLRCYNIV